ncbi:MAG TPA: aldo/keto reductase [Gemmatimonadales bacterium]|nr:aldo/keto reductase [Gemmatimonadales bacterium]
MRTISLAGTPVSVIGYGGMHLSLTDRPAETESVKVIHAALDAGMTLIDTADAYCLDASETGHNERLIARALREWHGSAASILVATKGGIVRGGGRWDRNGHPDHLRRACEASLSALGVEQIGLYQFHAPDPAVPFEESVGALADLQRAGKVRRIGLSNVSVDQIRQARAITPIASVQNRLNPYFREALSGGVVQYCAREGILFLAYSPTGGGRLTLKLPSHPVLSSIGRRTGYSPHAVCLAWVVAQGSTVAAIPSARRIAHALDSAAAADLVLTPEDLAAIDAATFDKS